VVMLAAAVAELLLPRLGLPRPPRRLQRSPVRSMGAAAPWGQLVFVALGARGTGWYAGAGSERAPPPPASLRQQQGLQRCCALLRILRTHAGRPPVPPARVLAAQLGAPRNVAAATYYEAWRRASKQRAHAPAPTG
jgi:hypothetical protein